MTPAALRRRDRVSAALRRRDRVSAVLRDAQFWVPVAALVAGLLVLRWIR